MSHPELNPVRRKLVDELVALAADPPAGLAALSLSERHERLGHRVFLPSRPLLSLGWFHHIDAAERRRETARPRLVAQLRNLVRQKHEVFNALDPAPADAPCDPFQTLITLSSGRDATGDRPPREQWNAARAPRCSEVGGLVDLGSTSATRRRRHGPKLLTGHFDPDDGFLTGIWPWTRSNPTYQPSASSPMSRSHAARCWLTSSGSAVTT